MLFYSDEPRVFLVDFLGLEIPGIVLAVVIRGLCVFHGELRLAFIDLEFLERLKFVDRILHCFLHPAVAVLRQIFFGRLFDFEQFFC
jgi:hypothetical protein